MSAFREVRAGLWASRRMDGRGGRLRGYSWGPSLAATKMESEEAVEFTR